MIKSFDAVFLYLAIIVLVIAIPLKLRGQYQDARLNSQQEYELDYLAWEIQTFHKIDVSVLPTRELTFYCYNDEMELEAVFTPRTTLDFRGYHAVVFEYNGRRKGVCLE